MPLSKVGAAMNITSGQMQQLQKEAVRIVKYFCRSLFKKCLRIKVNVGWRSSTILYRYANINTFHFTTLHCISHHYIAFYNTTSHNTTYHAILYHYLLRYIFLHSHVPQATFCGMTVVFCRKLNWTHLASCLETYTGRLGFGVRDELLALVRMGSEVSFLIPSISYYHYLIFL